MKKYKNSNILIMGAASGIGRLMALKLIKYHPESLILVDLNEKLLHELTQELEVKVYPYVLNLQNLEEVTRMFHDLREKGIGVDILINNAGVVVGKNFEDHTHEDIKFTLQVNTAAPMHLAREALEMMKVKKQGHIVNISSAASLVSNPGMSVYCASKWAVVGWSDSLRLELSRKYPDIRVTTVLPYYINTGMFDGVSSPVIPILEPEYVANKILKAVNKNRIFLKMPWIINFVPLLKGILPTFIFDLLADKFFGIYNSMSSFKGKS